MPTQKFRWKLEIYTAGAGLSQWARKSKKVQAKKNSWNQINQWPKINFWTRKKFKNAISCKKFFGSIWFYEFFCLDFLKFSGLICTLKSGYLIFKVRPKAKIGGTPLEKFQPLIHIFLWTKSLAKLSMIIYFLEKLEITNSKYFTSKPYYDRFLKSYSIQC